jgi:hypothetical protein
MKARIGLVPRTSKGPVGAPTTTSTELEGKEPSMLHRALPFAALFVLISMSGTSARTAADPEAVVRAYTAAANDGDLDRFLSLYDPKIRKFRFPGQLTSVGIEHNRKSCARSFAANPDLRVDIVRLIGLGDKVMVHDRVTGLATGQTSDELTVYQVAGGRITNILYVERIAR